MQALLEQFSFLLPLFGIALAALVVGLLWVSVFAIGRRPQGAQPDRPAAAPMTGEIGYGAAYDSSATASDCGPSADIGGDCGGNGGGD